MGNSQTDGAKPACPHCPAYMQQTSRCWWSCWHHQEQDPHRVKCDSPSTTQERPNRYEYCWLCACSVVKFVVTALVSACRTTAPHPVPLQMLFAARVPDATRLEMGFAPACRWIDALSQHPASQNQAPETVLQVTPNMLSMRSQPPHPKKAANPDSQPPPLLLLLC